MKEADGGFGSVLRSLRFSAGLTQDELARRSGMSVRAISDMESGRTTRPFLSSVRLLAQALGPPGPQRDMLISAARGTCPEPQPPLDDEPRAAEPGAAATRTAPVPRQLPVNVPRLYGRRRELGTLNRALERSGTDSAAVIISVCGMAGVGKPNLGANTSNRYLAVT